MFDLKMNFSRNFERQQESFEEGILQITGCTINDNTVIVNLITVNLNQQVPLDYTDTWPDLIILAHLEILFKSLPLP